MICAVAAFLSSFAHLCDSLELFRQQSSALCPQSCCLWGRQPSAMNCMSFQPFLLWLLDFFSWLLVQPFFSSLEHCPLGPAPHHLLWGCSCDGSVWGLPLPQLFSSSTPYFWYNWQMFFPLSSFTICITCRKQVRLSSWMRISGER